MPYPLLLESIARYITLSPDEEAYFLSLLVAKSYRRRETMHREGQRARESAFVLSGCMRSYAIDKSGTEHVLSFAPAGWWIGDFSSHISGKPGILTIDALEPTEALLITHDAREELFARVPSFERFFRILIERSLAAHQQRLLDTLILTAAERYLHFCQYYPTLIDTLPQKQIASFIGVTPEFFSKMRSGLLRKGEA